jgi:hypothetical protein
MRKVLESLATTGFKVTGRYRITDQTYAACVRRISSEVK